MADTPSHPGTPLIPDSDTDTDLIVVGGGPAGCAAARMAAGVGMRSVLIEPDILCRNLYRIPALDNVLGGHTSGPELADSITTELKSTEPCRLELGRHATCGPPRRRRRMVSGPSAICSRLICGESWDLGSRPE